MIVIHLPSLFVITLFVLMVCAGAGIVTKNERWHFATLAAAVVLLVLVIAPHFGR